MRYSINNYVEALAELLEEMPVSKRGQIASNFVKILKKNGDFLQRGKIIEKLHQREVNSKGGRWIMIELARKISESKIKLLQKNFSKKDHVEIKLNTALIAGLRVTVDGQSEVDNSLNNKLKEMFK